MTDSNEPPSQTTVSARGYDRISAWYRWIEWSVFGSRLQAARVALLDRLEPVKHILVLGDGDGRFLAALCRAQPAARITSVDHSERMIGRQRWRIGSLQADERVDWVCCDALTYVPEEDQFDLIVTPFFLDCFTEEQLRFHFPRWLSGLRGGGQIYHVDFVRPCGGMFNRAVGRGLLWTMHVFFRWQTLLPNRTLVDLRPIFCENGCTRTQQVASCFDWITTEIWNWDHRVATDMGAA